MQMHVRAHEHYFIGQLTNSSLITSAMAGNVVSAATSTCHEFGTAHFGSVHCS